jgi:MFS family permease
MNGTFYYYYYSFLLFEVYYFVVVYLHTLPYLFYFIFYFVYKRYDFAVYGLLAVEIGATFFPQSSKELQLVNSFGVYLAAFIMRPIGAILFGEIGDRIVGRKHALVFSILLITIPSVLMGVLPGYDTWGWISPILLVLLRMMQGLSVGGQLAGSYVLSIEQSSAKSRGFRGCVCDASSVRIFLRFYFPYALCSFFVFVLLNGSVQSSLSHAHTHTLHILFNRLVDSCWHRW